MDLLHEPDFYYKVVFYIGLGTTAIFVIQSLLTIFGASLSDGIGHDFDVETHGHFGPMQMFTFRNLVNFLLGFSWTAIALHHSIENKMIISLLAALAGVLLVIGVLAMMRQLQKLAQDKTMKIESAIGKTCSVYLTIPAEKSGKGKVHISIQDTLRELDAMTEGEMIPTNSTVVVADVLQHSILLVNKI
jgi:hypothetical protein